MSTRGCVAVLQEGNGESFNDYGLSWRGVYNHFDSYPGGLGAEVHSYFAAVPPDDLPAVLRAMLEHNDWRDFLAGGVCEYCGKKGLGQPHTISGALGLDLDRWRTPEEMQAYYSDLPAWRGRTSEINRMVDSHFSTVKAVRETGYPDPEAKGHEHYTGPVESQHLTSERPNPLFIEWVYIVDPLDRKIHVLSHTDVEQLHQYNTLPSEDDRLQPENFGWNYGHCAYKHVLVGTASLDEPFDSERFRDPCGDGEPWPA